MTGPLYRLGGLASRHWKIVIPLWLVFVVAVVIGANAAGRPTNNNLDLPGTGSTRATELLASGLPEQQNGSVPIVLRAREGTLTEGSNRAAVQQTVKALSEDPYVNLAVSPLSQQGAQSLTDGGRLGFISLFLNLSSGELSAEEAEQIFSRAEPARAAGISVSAGGYLGSQLSIPDTASSDALGVLVAIFVLLAVFGAVATMAMPIATALLALLAGLGLIGFLGTAIDVPQVAPTLGTMLGLAVGIDYSLFIISRHQRQVREGMEPHESAARSIATAGSAVVFAGSTVVVALLCLYFGGVELVRALGYAAALVVVVAVVSALTLLPALMGALGHRVEALGIPFLKGPPPTEDRGNGWARWAARIGRRPWPFAAAGVALLIVLAIPVSQLQLGAIDYGQYPGDTTERRAYDELSEGFGVGLNAPLLVAVSFPGNDPAKGASDPRLTELQGRVKGTGGVASVTPAQLDRAGTTAVFSAIPATGPSAEATRSLVEELRDEVIPGASSGGLRAFVGGQTASFVDLASEISEELVLVILIVVALGFLLIAAAFRSIVIPALAALLNLLAVVAAYGILTAVFELGWGVSLIGLEESLPVVSFVPLLMFAILFGLSMDYQVFLLTRAKERWDLSQDPREAVVVGLGLASRVVVAAASIMFAVFASFVLNGDPTVKQFGVGLAIAVALDALVVVAIMPALMLMLGRWTWWFPAWMERLIPSIGIEGEQYFEDLDARSD